ncbi:MAG TPA: hypothetical protein VMN39_12750, partial [Longimicrobiaceae bacterium]|nr:hypothetical protein [Longimicrobiaceae bacterium]
MSPHALEVLEFGAALGVVAGLAASGLGRAAVEGLRPMSSAADVRHDLAFVAEGIALLGGEAGWPMPDLPDLREPLQRLRLEGYGWDGPTLRAGMTLLTAARAVRGALLPRRDDVPGLAGLAETLADLPEAIERIDRAVAEDGEVRDSASPELARLRREIHGARGRIVRKLTDFAAGLPDQYQVSDASVSVRDGRYVVPVRREGRGEVGGIVHGESQTGSTLFIEPPVAIELMNRLRELESAEAREVQRILRELTDRLRPYAAELSASLEALVGLDSIYARARYAVRTGGQPPEVFDAADGVLQIVGGRHPLLLATGEPVVPFDLRMEDGERTLVISGPNTGGKTVLLKSIGLLALLTQSGVVPPLERGTRLPVFTGVFADIGDEQSIEASLSTFSAHLKNLRETLADADSGSLVLIDEIGSGTD